ncbi:MAG: hypothetical protein ACRC46_02385 [Thermoguttaceae bacterium]
MNRSRSSLPFNQSWQFTQAVPIAVTIWQLEKLYTRTTPLTESGDECVLVSRLESQSGKRKRVIVDGMDLMDNMDAVFVQKVHFVHSRRVQQK